MALFCSVQGQGENLVLLHGWGMNSAVWEGVLPYLQAHYRVHCIDLPGHGASGDVEAGLDAWLNALEAVLPEQFYLCGWSLGGMLALALQQRWPERVQGLVMIGASPRFLAGDDWPAQSPEDLQAFAQRLQSDVKTTLKQFVGLQFLGVKDSRAAVRTVLAGLQEQGAVNEAGLQQGLSLLQSLDLREAFAEQACAVLLGKQDRLVPAALAPVMRDLNPDAAIEVWSDCGHAPHLAQPRAVAGFIHQHLAGGA